MTHKINKLTEGFVKRKTYRAMDIYQYFHKQWHFSALRINFTASSVQKIIKMPPALNFECRTIPQNPALFMYSNNNARE
jgi:alkyl sulfatase BDS1-like metallo-beta-lactamase superfamily hydrolase